MQIFRVLGATFAVISGLIIVVTILPMVSAFGGGGFGGFGMMMALPSILFTLVPLAIVFLVIANVFKAMNGPSVGGIPGGVAATARVRSTSRTTMRVNDQPVLRIDLDLTIVGLPTVPVSVRRAVPREHLALVAPGAVLPAVADPANPRRFAIDWAQVGMAADAGGAADLGGDPGSVDMSGVIDQLAAAGIRLDPGLLGGAGVAEVHADGVADPVPPSQLLGTAPASGAAGVAGAAGSIAGAVPGDVTVDVTGATLSALRATGEPGRGVIRAATDLGIAIGDGRLYRLTLDVIPEGRTGFSVEHVTVVPASSLWRMVTGVTLPLFLDRSEPGRLAIDWSA